jgi:hypothetical protein
VPGRVCRPKKKWLEWTSLETSEDEEYCPKNHAYFGVKGQRFDKSPMLQVNIAEQFVSLLSGLLINLAKGNCLMLLGADVGGTTGVRRYGAGEGRSISKFRLAIPLEA